MLRLLPRPLQHQGHMSSYCTQASAACHSARQRWVVTSEAALHSLAAALSHKLQAGDVYLLYGQVGAGKTTFRHVPCAGTGSVCCDGDSSACHLPRMLVLTEQLCILQAKQVEL